MSTYKWLADDIWVVHTSDIWMTYKHIWVTYRWHKSTYKWHMHNIQALMSDIWMSSVCTRISSVCHSYVFVCHPYVTRLWFYHEPQNIWVRYRWHMSTYKWHTNDIKVIHSQFIVPNILVSLDCLNLLVIFNC